jgi:hypothetical protein
MRLKYFKGVVQFSTISIFQCSDFGFRFSLPTLGLEENVHFCFTPGKEKQGGNVRVSNKTCIMEYVREKKTIKSLSVAYC